jgi:hypothetical protein
VKRGEPNQLARRNKGSIFMHTQLNEVLKFIRAALECSVYVSPTDPGLTHAEIIEVGARAGFQPGEIGDALPQVADQLRSGPRLLPSQTIVTFWGIYQDEDPEYRNFSAFDFVFSELRASVRVEGAQKARIERSVLVERAIAGGIPRNDVEVAITMSVMAQHLVEKDGLLRFAPRREHAPLPSEQRRNVRAPTIRYEARLRAYQLVRDVIERRTDGRRRHPESLDAFADELENLGYGPFRLWWKQIVVELRRGDTQLSPVSGCVLAAALVEGALTFVVKHARGLGVMGSKDFDQEPRYWRLEKLVASASAGGDSAILDSATRARTDQLVRVRQRIHAGRMLSDFPGGPPDLRPEEARDARQTADLVVRRILDWLDNHPADPASVPKSQ